MKQRLIIAFAVALVLAGAYVGFSKYDQHRFIESITPLVKNASLRLMNAARLETEKTKITYKELFEKLEGDIAEIDKKILDVQTLSTQSNKDVTDPVLDYLKGGQDFLRSLLASARKSLATKSAEERAIRSNNAIDGAGTEWAYAAKLAREAIQDWKAAAKEAEEARSEVMRTANGMKPLIDKIADRFPSDVLVQTSLTDAVAKKYEESNK